MASRNQNKPPIPRSSAKGSEEVPLDKRRKIVVGRAGVAVRNVTRSRQVLSALNAAPPPTDAATDSDAGSTVGELEFTSLDDVKNYLKEMIPGKKTFFKGKAEKLEFMRKYKSCIEWLERTEDENLQEQERLRGLIEDGERKYAEMEAQLRTKVDKLNSELEALKGDHASLHENYRREEADKLAINISYNQEKEARYNAEKARDALSEDLCRAQQKIKVLQDRSKQLQEYNSSLHEYNNGLQNDVTNNKETITNLQKEKETMMESLSDLRSQYRCLQEQFSSLRSSQQEIIKEKEELQRTIDLFKSELQQVRDDRNFQFSQVQSLTADLTKYKESTGKAADELQHLTTKHHDLEERCSAQELQIQILQRELGSAAENFKTADSENLKTLSAYEQQNKLIFDLQKRLADAEVRIVDGEKLRKKLHNTILELKGNIRVFCRVRPFFPDRDCSGTGIPVVSYPTSIESVGRGIDLMHNGKAQNYKFDKVFDHDASQEDVFVEISQLVQSALDGYKVCIFAYGQTGSGKTYTMMGRQEAPEFKGLIPRSVEQIFESSQSLLCEGWKYKMQASMLEIYNETIRDLLVPNRTSPLDANVAAGKQYTIKHDQNGNTNVSDLSVVDVCSIKQVNYLLQQAARSRSVSKTLMNDQSSRSHFVFMLRISGVNEGTEQQVQGVLNLIDLAGSERLDKSGSTGDRLKETQHINKSLLALSEVISSIARKEDHIPFRNSKLTYLLQPCLGGESKTLMFVNISPEPSSTGESKSALDFASKVNQCEIGVPRRQTQAQVRITDSRLSCG